MRFLAESSLKRGKKRKQEPDSDVDDESDSGHESDDSLRDSDLQVLLQILNKNLFRCKNHF